MDSDSALFVSGVASLTLICIALFYRGLVSEAFDSVWLQVNARRVPAPPHGLFLALLVLNLVAGFQVLGTLMAVGVMRRPRSRRAAGRGRCRAFCCWRLIPRFLRVDGAEPVVGGNLPAGPAIALTASGLFFISVFFGSRSRLVVGWRKLMG
ncbi:metal ABC transporter permease [Escherichia coli]